MRATLALITGLILVAPPAGAGGPKLEVETADGSWSARISGRVQPRLTVRGFEEGPADAFFTVQRARFKVAGSLFEKGLGYLFQVGFGKGGARLEDFYIDWFYSADFGLRVGQLKMPFSRQQLTSSGKQLFVDRALTDKAVGAGRDIGVMLLSHYAKSNLEWAVGVFNGQGANTVPETGRFNPTVVLRAGWHGDGMKGYSEADLAGGGFRFAGAANAKLSFDHENDPDSAHRTRVETGVDFSVKWNHLAVSGAGYVSLAGDEIGSQEMVGQGGHGQVSYAIGGRWAPHIRYAAWVLQEEDTRVQEVQVGFSAFVYGHSLKWQTDFTLRQEDLDNRAILMGRTQAQLAF